MDRVIFTEKPYAAVLYADFVHSHCANCFHQSAGYSCPKQCGYAQYCDEVCCADDFRWHEFECAAFQKLKEKKQLPVVESRVRLIGRLLVRLQFDNGAASLSEGFPHYVKDRKFGDLLSHYEEFQEDSWSSSRLRWTSSQFSNFFASTPLKSTPSKTVQVTFCALRINSFCILNDTITLGLGLYLNASRFNHSCVPTARASFIGNRIQVKVRPGVHPQEYSTENRFDNLTIDYGARSYSSIGCYITVARDRIDSLKERYFFRCICPACVDSKMLLLEQFAANVECEECGIPYVWTRKGEMNRICGCVESPAPVVSGKDKRAVIQLNHRWKDVMARIRDIGHENAIQLCEPLLKLARRFWHSTQNLRLAQLIERLAVAYGTNEDSTVDEEGCKARSDCFDAIVACYSRNSWSQSLIPKYHKLAEFWKSRAAVCQVGQH